MDYQIAIPSYHRENILGLKTLKTIEKLKGDFQKVTVFVADESEHAKYTEALKDWNVKIVTGVPGIIHQRIFYNRYYPANTRILNMDDDIEGLYVKQGDGLKPYTGTLDQLVQTAFAHCEERGIRLWGLAAALNGRFMTDTMTVGLRYICGVIHGSYAGDLCVPNRFMESSGEDFETTLQSFERYGKVLRFDGIGPKTKYFAPGGIRDELNGKKERQIAHDEALEKIAALHPNLAQVYDKANGKNIRLKNITLEKISVYW